MAEESEDESGKTEEPTAKKLEEARKKGEVVSSRELNHWFMILGGTLFVMVMAGPTSNQLASALRVFIERPHTIPLGDIHEMGNVMATAVKTGILAVLIPFMAFIVAALAGTVLQTGFMWAPDLAAPKLDRVSPMQGLTRLFSRKNVLEVVKGIAKLSIVAAVELAMIWPLLPALEHSADISPVAMMEELRKISLRVLGGVLAIMFLVAVLDYVLQRIMFMMKMRMSRSEMKEEYKQAEGDPQIKQRIRQIRTERARMRMMADVPRADVIITNPDHYAVALEYKPPEHVAPIVVAVGVDLIAQKIKEIARENDIPIIENPPLARALYASSDIGHQIPAEHFKAVAEIISYVFKLKNRTIKKP